MYVCMCVLMWLLLCPCVCVCVCVCTCIQLSQHHWLHACLTVTVTVVHITASSLFNSVIWSQHHIVMSIMNIDISVIINWARVEEIWVRSNDSYSIKKHILVCAVFLKSMWVIKW